MFGNNRTILMVLILTLALFVDVANADYTFGTPTNLGPTVNSFDYDWSPSIRADGLEMYFESDRPGGEGTYDIWVSTRATKEDDWGAPTNLGSPINTPDWQNSPSISADGLELYYNDWGLWVRRRATVSDPWGEPENHTTSNLNAIGGESPSLSSDGLSLFLYTRNDWDLYVSTRPTRDDLWSEPVNLGPTVNGVNSTWRNRGPTISADGLLLVFTSNRDGGSGGMDLWMTRRTTIDGPWSEPVNLGPTINGDKWDGQPEISADGRTLLFCSNRDGGHGDFDIWQASIDPVVDLNADGIVDSADMVIMVDNWGTDNSLCDIGPTPFGDGIVDVQDLIVLAEHLFEEVVDPNAADFIVVEDFDSLAVGTNMHDVDGWEGWYGDSSKGARVTDAVAYSGTNSLEIVGNRDDLVRNWPKLTTGKWVLSVMQYCPSDKQTTGIVYFGILTEYDGVAGTKAWIGELRANFAAGKAYYSWNSTIQVDLVYDEWVELRLEVDLDAQVADFYYNNVFLATAASPVPSLVGVNIFPEPSIEAVYFDDLRIEAGQ
jgi:hypothetical protein